MAKAFKIQMAKPDLVFVTKENEEMMKAAALDRETARCKGCGFIAGAIHDCPGAFAEEAKGPAGDGEDNPA